MNLPDPMGEATRLAPLSVNSQRSIGCLTGAGTDCCDVPGKIRGTTTRKQRHS